MQAFNFITTENDIGQRIDKLISVKLENFTRAKAQLLITKGLVFVNGKEINPENYNFMREIK